MPKIIKHLLVFIISILILAGCLPGATRPTQTTALTTATPLTIKTSAAEQATPGLVSEDLPASVEYNLGETTITQSMFTEDSRFRNMPVRLNGIIAAPDAGDGPFPVVVILHGNHRGCPVPEGDTIDRWPCDPDLEQPNYRGYEYLIRRLAAHGIMALSININAEYTIGFGEPIPNERLKQLVDLHLQALAEATGGGLQAFGLDLNGRADLSRLVFIGHSQGGEGAYWLVQDHALDSPDALVNIGYGPVVGVLMVAPSGNLGGAKGARIPLAILLPACDNDVFQQEGQLYYEITRLDPDQNPWASSVWLERANHNYFNEILRDEAVTRPGRPDCEPLLTPQAQRDFLSEYTLDFLDRILSQDPGATARLGMDLSSPAPDQLYEQSARIAGLVPDSDRLPLLLPAAASELETSLQGGEVIAEDLTLTYCKEGYFIPSMVPGSEPCKRVNLTIPGNPAMIVAGWTGPEAALRFSLPEELDLSGYSAISLRAALDPLSSLNPPGAEQALTVRLVDVHGATASLSTRAGEPALEYPEGNQEESDTFDGGWFTGRVPLTSIRLPLQEFTGVDLSAIQEIAILFDRTPSGTLFMSDFELVR
jgi:hypothetical protein